MIDDRVGRTPAVLDWYLIVSDEIEGTTVI